MLNFLLFRVSNESFEIWQIDIQLRYFGTLCKICLDTNVLIKPFCNKCHFCLPFLYLKRNFFQFIIFCVHHNTLFCLFIVFSKDDVEEENFDRKFQENIIFGQLGWVKHTETSSCDFLEHPGYERCSAHGLVQAVQ